MAMLFQNAFEAALLAFLAGIPRRMGTTETAGASPHPSGDFDAHARNLHHIDYYLNLIKRAGFDAMSGIPWVFLGLEERLKARDTLALLNVPSLRSTLGRLTVRPSDGTPGVSRKWRKGDPGDWRERCPPRRPERDRDR